MFKLAISVIVFVLVYAEGGATNYSTNYLRKTHPDYGVKWIYFPDEKEVPCVGYLQMPAGEEVPEVEVSEKEVENDIFFRLYTRKQPLLGEALNMNSSLASTKFNLKRETKFITHGWMSSSKSDTSTQIRDAFLKQGDVNVILVDWSAIAQNIFYPIPMSRAKPVGRVFARFVDKLVEQGVDPQRMHLVGHSLGAHVSGFVGRFLKNGTISRITGLDPALPGFTHKIFTDRLSYADADYVDIIHTCGGVLGFSDPLGHADFYPNGGGPPQPGCTGLAEVIEGCSHGRSWKYFLESIQQELVFLSYRCSSWKDYILNSCSISIVPMGDKSPRSARGLYFLKTKALPPYYFEDETDGIRTNQMFPIDNKIS